MTKLRKQPAEPTRSALPTEIAARVHDAAASRLAATAPGIFEIRRAAIKEQQHELS